MTFSATWRSNALAILASALVIAGILLLGPGVALLLAVAAIGAVIVLRAPVVGIIALVLILPFNGLVTQVASETVASIYGASKDAILALLLVRAIASGRMRAIPAGILSLVLAIVLLPMISGLLSPTLTQALYGWRNNYEPLLLLVVVAAVTSERHIRPILVSVALVAQVAATLSVATWSQGLQWVYDIGRLPVPEGSPFPTSLFSQGSIQPRAFSPYVAPNEMAAANLIALATIWCVPNMKARYRLLMTILPALAIILSQSRSGLLGGAVLAMLLISRAMKSRSALLSIGFLIIAGMGVLSAAVIWISESLQSGSDSSFGGHADSLQDGLRDVLLHPLGMGLGVVGPRAAQFDTNYHVESFWLLLALEAGPLVLILFLALLAALVVRSSKAESLPGFLIAAALVATAVSQIVLPTLQEGAVSFLLWTVGGVSLAAQRFEAQEVPLHAAVASIDDRR